MAKVNEFYAEEIYENAERKAIGLIDEKLALARSGSDEERRLYQNLTDLIKVHDARIQAKRDHEYRMAQASREEAKWWLR